MIDRLGLDVEVLTVAGDQLGLYLIPRLNWPNRTVEPLTGYDDPHHVAMAMAVKAADGAEIRVLHQTSSRYEEAQSFRLGSRPARGVWTYLAIADCDPDPGAVRLRWPAAEPIDPAALLGVHRPTSWTGPDSPAPDRLSVAIHAVRHAAMLAATDDAIAARLPEAVAEALAAATPALSTMFRDPAIVQ